jgi:hypothetical protein
MFRSKLAVLTILGSLLLSTTVRAQEVGTVAAADGDAQLGRSGTWRPAAVGAAVRMGDELQTGAPGRIRVVFQDDSVLTLSESSHVVIDKQVFDPSKGQSASFLGLLRGKVNAVVSEYYHQPGNVYEIKTPNATAGVRGTEFTIAYNVGDQTTEVVGISGHVMVHSALDPTGKGVLVTANEATRVVKDQLPTTPERLEEGMFRQQLHGFDFVGGGRAESLTAVHAVRTGASVPPPDRAPAVVASNWSAAPGGSAQHDASTLVGDSPAIVKAVTGQIGIVFPK